MSGWDEESAYRVGWLWGATGHAVAVPVGLRVFPGLAGAWHRGYADGVVEVEKPGPLVPAWYKES